jgi:hypothetical protein
MSRNLTTTDHEKALKTIQKVGVTRYLSVQANVELKDKITVFASYVGSDGKASTSPKGIAIFIAHEIKKSFGFSVKEMPDQMLSNLTALLSAIVQIINNGTKRNLPRMEIRQQIKDVIKLNKQQYDIINGENHE